MKKPARIAARLNAVEVPLFAAAAMVIAAEVLIATSAMAGERRTWTDASGKHQIEAELIAVDGDEVRLERADRKELTLPLNKLSAADRAYVRKHLAAEAKRAAANEERGQPAANEAARKQVREVAERFYRDLRTTERDDAWTALTEAARAANKKEKSPLAQLPSPDAANRAIRVGKVRVSGEQAEVDVQVRSAGATHKTALHLRQENDTWRVFAISTALGNDERTFNFEAEATPDKPQENPLAALVGQTARLEGFLLDGTPLDLSQFAGKVVLIDFWATWCGPCLREMPNILANWQQYHEQGFEVIAVSVDKDLNAVKSFVLEEQPPWAVVVDQHPRSRGAMASLYGIRGIPAMILVGKDGKVAAVNTRGQRLGNELAKLLGG